MEGDFPSLSCCKQDTVEGVQRRIIDVQVSAAAREKYSEEPSQVKVLRREK